jgi:Na+/melibiose symporter-like transporter
MSLQAAPAIASMGAMACLRYGLLGLPLAFVALPLYLHLPNYYAREYAMPLGTLGSVLLLARLFDAITDPWLGRLGDRLHARSPRRVLGAGGVAALLLLAGLVLLFFPPWPHAQLPIALLLMLIFTSLAFSFLSITHQSWGARLGGNELQRARIVAWREAAALLGVVLASVLPSWLGWDQWITVFALALVAGWLAWSGSPSPQPLSLAHTSSWREDLIHPWRASPFRRLLAVFILSGLASAVPATLVLFFIQDRLQAAAWEPLFLGTYFIAAATAMPLWLRGVARWGLAHCWLAGMLLSVMVFAWAATLGSGDILAFWWVCALSGLALGADLALPGALLAGLISERGEQGQREGAYFGWWNLAAKLNLALAAGLALPLLEWLGYQPGAANASGLQALSLAYAVLPCAIKSLAALGLYLAFVRPLRLSGPALSKPEESP